MAFNGVLAGDRQGYGRVEDGTQALLSSAPVPNSLGEGRRRPAFLEKTDSVLQDGVSGARGPPIPDAVERGDKVPLGSRKTHTRCFPIWSLGDCQITGTC